MYLDKSIKEINKLLKDKKIKPLDLVEEAFANIEKHKEYNAYITLNKEEAIKRAKELENKEVDNILFGLPIAVKDNICTEGLRTTCASHILDNFIPIYNATIVNKINDKNMIIIGKTNMDEFAMGSSSRTSYFGAPCNPWDISKISGGSSGGSAAAVADGLLLLAEGGDAGGSIRIPSGWCNLFGFKPSKGTVPSYCRPDGWTATHPFCFNGALTKTVADSAVMLNEMSYYNPRDPISLPINSDKNFLRLMTKGVKDMKIGFTYDFSLFPAVDEEVKRAVYSTAMLLESAGAYIEPVNFSWKFPLEEIMRTWAWSISVDTALDIQLWKSEGLDLVKDHRDELPEEFIEFNEMASRAGINYMRIFNEIRTNILDNFEDAFEQYDLIISPTAICPPMKHEDEGRCKRVNGLELDPETNFISFGETALVNFVGYPAASVPAGIIYDTLPTGMQIIAPMFRDENIFAASHMIEMLKPWNYDLAFNRS